MSKNNNKVIIRRIIAYFIDWYIVCMITAIPINLIYAFTYQKINYEISISKLPLSQAIISFLIGFILTLVYLIYIPYKCNGQTLGKKLLHLQIVSRSHKQLSVKTLFLRNCFGILFLEGSFYICSTNFWRLLDLITGQTISIYSLNIVEIICISSIILLLFTKKYMLHDIIAKTSVNYIK